MAHKRQRSKESVAESGIKGREQSNHTWQLCMLIMRTNRCQPWIPNTDNNCKRQPCTPNYEHQPHIMNAHSKQEHQPQTPVMSTNHIVARRIINHIQQSHIETVCFDHAYNHEHWPCVSIITPTTYNNEQQSNHEHQSRGLTIYTNHDLQPWATNLTHQSGALIVHTKHDHWPCMLAVSNQACIPDINTNHMHHDWT